MSVSTVREAVVSGARHFAGVRMHTGSSSISRSRRRWPVAGAASPACAAQLDVDVGHDRLAHLSVALEAHSTVLGAMAETLLARWLALAEGRRQGLAA